MGIDILHKTNILALIKYFLLKYLDNMLKYFLTCYQNKNILKNKSPQTLTGFLVLEKCFPQKDVFGNLNAV